VGYKGLEVEVKEHFFSRNEYALRLRNVFYPIWITFHVWDIITRPLPQLNLGFDTLTQYPGSIGANNPIDGYAGEQDVDLTWTNILAGVGNFYRNSPRNDSAVLIKASTTSSRWGRLRRSFFLFDTSSLTSSAIISAVTLSLYGTGKTDPASWTPNINIYTSTPASNTTLANSDYNGNVGSTAQCDTVLTYANMPTAAYYDFTLNTTGRGNVSKTGISKFGARNANYDVANTSPTWSSGAQAYWLIYWASNGSNKPKLVITYTLPATNTGNFFMLF